MRDWRALESALSGGPGATLAFGAAEAFFHVGSTAYGTPQLTVDVPVAGTGGLAKSGPGILILSRHNSYTGGTTLNQGVLVSAAQGALSSGPVMAAGGSLGFQSENQTVTNEIQIAPNASLPVSVAPGTVATLAGAISGAGAFNLSGNANGTLRLTGPLNITGRVAIGFNSSGTLYLDGTVNCGFVDISDGILGGTGTIDAPVLLRGEKPVISPGDSGPGILTVQSITTITSSSVFHFDLNGTQVGTQYSQLRVNQPTVFPLNSGHLYLSLGYAPQPGDSFILLNNLSFQPIYDSFAGLPEGALFTVGSTRFQITYKGGDGNDVVVTAVPEPALGLLAVGVLGLGRRARRREIKSSHTPCIPPPGR